MFTVLGQLPAVGLAEIGIVICVGVLLDTFVVRTVLVPAVALLLGDRFWWPRTTAQPRTQRPSSQAITLMSSTVDPSTPER